ncbi:hypothetical protein [Streptococcus thoraltensis]|uniref:hypothetical protein n=1 Tax=Streptococcus thoraltensis TaxID=55085 RepID=UPI001F587FB1|nr:hypothetical protein [Streptococcus thoraltensis]
MIPFYRLDTDNQNKLKAMERQMAELERQLNRPDLHFYRNAIQRELDQLEHDYYSFWQFLDTLYNNK